MSEPLYIPASQADALSRALFRLERVPLPGEVTQSVFTTVIDLHGEKWLCVVPSYSLRVREDAELNGIADILQPWIDEGHLPTDTNTELAALVESKRGSRLVVYDAFPQLFKSMAKTREEMIAAGLLAEPAAP